MVAFSLCGYVFNLAKSRYMDGYCDLFCLLGALVVNERFLGYINFNINNQQSKTLGNGFGCDRSFI